MHIYTLSIGNLRGLGWLNVCVCKDSSPEDRMMAPKDRAMCMTQPSCETKKTEKKLHKSFQMPYNLTRFLPFSNRITGRIETPPAYPSHALATSLYHIGLKYKHLVPKKCRTPVFLGITREKDLVYVRSSQSKLCSLSPRSGSAFTFHASEYPCSDDAAVSGFPQQYTFPAVLRTCSHD